MDSTDRRPKPRHRSPRPRYRRLRLLAAVAVMLAGVTAAAPPSGFRPAEAAVVKAGYGHLLTPRPPNGVPSPGRYTGLGFDACTAPSNEAMRAWLASPYRAVGIYIGGVNRGCKQPNLTPDWVRTQQALGWKLFPLYVGLQAPCSTLIKRGLINPARAAAEGREAADDAAAQARALGLARDSVLIYDMEAYPTNNPGCRDAVVNFMGAYTARLHDLSYLSGFYSSMGSGVAHIVAAAASPAYPRPDYVDFARWDNAVTVNDPGIPAGMWEPKRRMKQYRGGHLETHGGVTINIDNNYLDFAPMPGVRHSDTDRNGWTDVLGVSATGKLYVYRGNGAGFNDRAFAGSGWSSMNQVTRLGDFNRDGYEDIIAREAKTGHIWLFPGTATGFSKRVKIASNWKKVREITAVGDFNRDGKPDVVAVGANGKAYLYPGNGKRLGAGKVIGSGFAGMEELAGVGDFNRDGYVDLVAKEKRTGKLFLYPGRGKYLGARKNLGTGWNWFRNIVGIGDFDRDGFTDLAAVRRSDGALFRYSGKGSALGDRSLLGTGWKSFRVM